MLSGMLEQIYSNYVRSSLLYFILKLLKLLLFGFISHYTHSLM